VVGFSSASPKSRTGYWLPAFALPLMEWCSAIADGIRFARELSPSGAAAPPAFSSRNTGGAGFASTSSHCGIDSGTRGVPFLHAK